MNSVSPLKSGLPLILFLTVHALYSVAYASTPADTEQPEKEFNTSYNPTDSLSYDHFVARIPLRYAPTAAAALATLNVALHNAKQQAEITLCKGQWAPRGSVVIQQGPTIERNSPREIPSWHFSATRHPAELACGTTSRTAFFLEMSRYLPAWIKIRPAGQLTAFQQGETVVLEQRTVATIK